MKKLQLLHKIFTDKSEYYIFNIENNPKKDLVSVGVNRIYKTFYGITTTKRILEKEIFDDSWGMLGADSFDSFVRDCLNRVRTYAKEHGEVIIEDIKLQ
jgi:hypothetical protein